VHPARWARVQRAWIITNPASGSAGGRAGSAIDAALAEVGVEVVGRTLFPDEELPTPQALDGAEIDTAVLFAGDGTINAAAGVLADWDGTLLILPGGTMNLLAKALHGDAKPAAIIAAAANGRTVALPLVSSGDYRAYVGLILGPAASWTWVREAVRAGRWKRMRRALGHAWRRTFGRGLRIGGIRGRQQAVFIAPKDDGLQVSAIDARSWRSIAELGWEWLTGDWVAAASVTCRAVPHLQLRERRPIHALFDGELRLLPVGARVEPGRSRPIFLSTLPEPQ
jgi:hypothetical protein